MSAGGGSRTEGAPGDCYPQEEVMSPEEILWGIRARPRDSLLSNGSRSEAILGMEEYHRQIFSLTFVTVA